MGSAGSRPPAAGRFSPNRFFHFTPQAQHWPAQHFELVWILK
jgi:hypothetical protein